MRECKTCPPQVTHCAHFEGRVVVLAEPIEPLCFRHRGFSVAVVEGAPDGVLPCCGVATWTKRDYRYGLLGGTYDEALAAFRGAELELLRGVAIG